MALVRLLLFCRFLLSAFIAAYAASATSQVIHFPGMELTRIPAQFRYPMYLTAPAGDSRLFVVEKEGRVQVVQRDGTKAEFLNIAGLVNSEGERGLLGLAFDPNFASNRHFYVDYIDATTRNTTIARYTVSATNPNLVDPASARVVFTVPQPQSGSGNRSHKAGWVGFRPGEPNNLYIATGDGGTKNTAQNLSDNLGKILRIDIRQDEFPGEDRNYGIPSRNPFVGRNGNDEIWAYGFRNPYRASFDQVTGRFFVADVGEGQREEVDLGVAGGNYGWPIWEGTAGNPPKPPDNVDPIFEYPHTTTARAAVIGGYVYRGGAISALEGKYIFGDFVRGNVSALEYDGSPVTEGEVLTLITDLGAYSINSFGQDGFGALYLTTWGGAAPIYRIAAAVPEPSTYALLVAGLTLLFGARLRRRIVIRPSGSSNGSDIAYH